MAEFVLSIMSVLLLFNLLGIDIFSFFAGGV